MTPVPLDLPLRPSEASALGNLILEQAERKSLTDEVRNRIAARAAVLKLESLRPYFGSLARDPVHPSTYYLAVDGAGGEGLLLHLALATAPTSSIFYKPLLIGRTRRPNGPEMVINAVPFSALDHENLDKFATKVDTAFLPRPQGSRTAIAAGSGWAPAFEAFRALWKRTGKNVAATACGAGTRGREGYSAGLWAAIRAGWREGYSAGVEIVLAGESLEGAWEGAREAVRQALGFSLYRIDARALFEDDYERGLRAVGQLCEHVRQSRAVAKIAKSFDLEVVLEGVDVAGVQCCLEWLKANGHAAHLAAVTVGEDFEQLAAVARQFQCGLSVGARAEDDAETLERIGRETEGRVQYRMMGNVGDVSFAAQHLVG